jgi:hypothetical protein
MFAVEEAASGTGSGTDTGPKGRVTGNRPDYRTRPSADGTPTEGPLFGIRHPCASTERKTDYQNSYYQ